MKATNNRRSRRRLWIGVLLLLPGVWLLCSGISYAVSTRVYMIPSASMSPTLRPGDRVGVQIRGFQAPKRGEIWVFHMPPASGTAPTIEAAKRVIGLPGETVEVANGSVLINGQPLDEPYLAAPIAYVLPPVTLGSNEYFMLGDSRNASLDSHVWGPLPGDYLVGPIKMRVWPMKRIGGL